MNTPYLHLYAQNFEHDDAWVVGTRDALEDLKKAIESALSTGKATKTEDLFVIDGEGFNVVIQCVEETTIYKLELPYIETDGGLPIKGVHPDRLLSDEDIKRIFPRGIS